MNKNNFFYPKKNNWDIGWPASPRKTAIIIIIMTSIIFCLVN